MKSKSQTLTLEEWDWVVRGLRRLADEYAWEIKDVNMARRLNILSNRLDTT